MLSADDILPVMTHDHLKLFITSCPPEAANVIVRGYNKLPDKTPEE
jgi:hypothetical protein